MIVGKVPLRITLGGGGSDLPGFYEKNGGFWLNTTVDKYVYVVVKPRFEPQIRLSYSELEFANRIDDIDHGIFREALRMFGLKDHIELISIADLPSGTGLGSSGAFTVALLGALYKYAGEVDNNLPEIAYRIERDNLNRVTGCQDHYAAYFGGCRAYTLSKKGKVTMEILNTDLLFPHLSLFYTNRSRNSQGILSEVKDAEKRMLEIKRIGVESYKAIKDMNYLKFGKLLNEHWETKRGITDKMSSDYIDNCYNYGLKNGAIGGKLIGAGGGGFLMFYSHTEEDRETLVKSLSTFMRYVPFKPVKHGLVVKEI